MTTATHISETEHKRRRALVDNSRHDAALEGLSISSQTHADEEAYVSGEIDHDELGHRIRQRYGIR